MTRMTHCTCDSVREGSGGITYTYAVIGVLCPACEAAAEYAEWQHYWESLTPQERTRIEIRNRWADALRRLNALGPRPGSPQAEPPF